MLTDKTGQWQLVSGDHLLPNEKMQVAGCSLTKCGSQETESTQVHPIKCNPTLIFGKNIYFNLLSETFPEI